MNTENTDKTYKCGTRTKSDGVCEIIRLSYFTILVWLSKALSHNRTEL